MNIVPFGYSHGPHRTSAIDLAALALDVFAQLTSRDPQRNVEVSVQPNLWASADASAAWFLLRALILNAWSSTVTRLHGGIAFACTNCHGQKVFYIRDNGRGICPIRAQRILQGRPASLSGWAPVGYTAGLVVARQIVQSYAGSIWCDGAVRTGLTVYFTLLIRPAVPFHAQDALARADELFPPCGIDS